MTRNAVSITAMKATPRARVSPPTQRALTRRQNGSRSVNDGDSPKILRAFTAVILFAVDRGSIQRPPSLRHKSVQTIDTEMFFL